MNGSSVPSGPRSSRKTSQQGSTLQPSRGGIHKRGSTPSRMDRDGDLDMASTDANPRGPRARGSGRGGRGASIRGAASSHRQTTPDISSRKPGSRLPGGGINTSAIQSAILKQIGSNDSGGRIPRSNTRERIRGAGDGLAKIEVFGLKESKAATNKDGGTSDLIAFLERKATHANEDPLKIKKSRLEGDILAVFIRPADVSRLLKIDNYTFAGTSLKIREASSHENASTQNNDNQTPGTIDALKSFLERRYRSDIKLLDLSQTGSDPELVKIGMFKTISTESKFFPALMKICDGLFASAKEKEEAVTSISLASNALPNISPVTALAQTFPNLKNLDISNNQISALKDMEGWRWRFPKLDHLILSGNPLEAGHPNLKEDIMRWYPSLTHFNNVQIRSQQEVQETKSVHLPLPTLGPRFQDEASIGESFIKQFFLGFDTDRNALVNGYYDSNSQFSLSVNVSAPRETSETSRVEPTPKWDQYIRKSRNLAKVSSFTAMRDRLCVGTNSIRDCFASLPRTKHPDLLCESEKWCIECNALPGLPEATGQSLTGVGGLLIALHGEFVEQDSGNGQPLVRRSFDRTFVLGPGGGIGGIRVINDMLVLRAYGGFQAWKPEADAGPIAAPTPGSLQAGQVPIPAGFGAPEPGKTPDQVQKEALALELSKATRMTLEYSAMCLEQSGWKLEEAAKVFEQAKANLPPDAFYQ